MKNIILNILFTSALLIIICELIATSGEGNAMTTTMGPNINFVCHLRFSFIELLILKTSLTECMNYMTEKMKNSEEKYIKDSDCRGELASKEHKNWTWRSLTIIFIVLFSLSLICCIFYALLDLFIYEKDDYCRIRMYAK